MFGGNLRPKIYTIDAQKRIVEILGALCKTVLKHCPSVICKPREFIFSICERLPGIFQNRDWQFTCSGVDVNPSACPNCGSCDLIQNRAVHDIESEIALRSQFVKRRLDHKPQPAELMDLTSFMHGGPGCLLTCEACGLTVRREPQEATYATDLYDHDLLTHLYPRYLGPFREKAKHCESYLPAHADVIEVGSHLGAFLQAAEERNWNATGLDIGESSSAFARHRGVCVKRKEITDAPFPNRSMDAVFIWNCFEQLENPAATLHAAHRLLRRHGVLVVRTPNFQFYEAQRSRRRALAYNNLLGFPYLMGYTPALLASFVSRHGFHPVAGFDSTVVTMPFPDVSSKNQTDFERVNAPYQHSRPQAPGALKGPWIEILYRRRD